MKDIGGAKICGKRGGRPFTKALRPTSNGSCPENSTPCSNVTSPENTICMYPNEKEKGLCPITEIKLVYENQYENSGS